MDAETLAAARWAQDGLPAGSRIGADRVSSVLLASQAGLWPVMKEDSRQLYVPDLYFSDEWGPPQSDIARRLHLKFLYVDRRLADELPQVGSYFYNGETPRIQQLTRAELTKFDAVPGIRSVYRHGPIAIYDLSGLGVDEVRSGWFGETPAISMPIQLVIGVLLGLMVTAFALSGAGSTVVGLVDSFRADAGATLTFAAILGALCVTATALLLAGVWLGPAVFLSAALMISLFNPRWLGHLLRNSVRAVQWKWVGALGVVALPVAAAIAQSVLSASAPDVVRPRTILHESSSEQPLALGVTSSGIGQVRLANFASCHE